MKLEVNCRISYNPNNGGTGTLTIEGKSYPVEVAKGNEQEVLNFLKEMTKYNRINDRLSSEDRKATILGDRAVHINVTLISDFYRELLVTARRVDDCKS